MITEADRKTIRQLSEKYHVKRVLLFGSGARPGEESRDIDIAVEGISPKDFYNYYGDLMLTLSKPIDLIDLSSVSKFTQMVRREGVPLYG